MFRIKLLCIHIPILFTSAVQLKLRLFVMSMPHVNYSIELFVMVDDIRPLYPHCNTCLFQPHSDHFCFCKKLIKSMCVFNFPASGDTGTLSSLLHNPYPSLPPKVNFARGYLEGGREVPLLPWISTKCYEQHSITCFLFSTLHCCK